MPDDKKPLFTEDERKLLAQQQRDMAELYPTPEAWERSYPPVARPEDPALRQQYDDYARMYPPEKPGTKERLADVTPEQKANVDKALGDAQSSDEIGGAGLGDEKRARQQRDLDTHDRLARGAAEASRDALHDSGPGKGPGDYTVREARDRAAHTPPIAQRDAGREPEK